MGQRGPARKPTALKLLAGNPGCRKLNDREPAPEIGAPSCPSWLDKEAKAEWKRATAQLLAMKVLTFADRAILAAYCLAWSELKAATQTLAAEGRYFTTEKGYVGQHPAVAVAKSAREQVRKLGAELGFSPASRTRIHVNRGKEAEENDPKEALKRRLGFA